MQKAYGRPGCGHLAGRSTKRCIRSPRLQNATGGRRLSIRAGAQICCVPDDFVNRLVVDPGKFALVRKWDRDPAIERQAVLPAQLISLIVVVEAKLPFAVQIQPFARAIAGGDIRDGKSDWVRNSSWNCRSNFSILHKPRKFWLLRGRRFLNHAPSKLPPVRRFQRRHRKQRRVKPRLASKFRLELVQNGLTKSFDDFRAK